MSENTQRAALESVRKDANDPTLTLGDTVFCRGVYVAVTGIHTYAPGMHGDYSPIRNDWKAVEVVTDEGSRWHGIEPSQTQSGYTSCACRDCVDTTVSSDVNTPELCAKCTEAGCMAIAPYNERIQYCTAYECQRDDAYGGTA